MSIQSLVSDISTAYTDKNQGASLSQQAYEHLSGLLLSNKLSPGDLVNRRQIAKDLKISVAPVLEAIVQLESEGLLESIPRKGTRVRSISIDDLRGQMILREAIECEAARIYCGEPVRKEQARLRPLAERLDGGDKQEMEKLWHLEYSFHLNLIQLTGIQTLATAYRNVMRSKLFMGMNLFLDAHPEAKRDNHVRLLRTLAKAEPNAAENLMRQHLRCGRQALFRDIR